MYQIQIRYERVIEGYIQQFYSLLFVLLLFIFEQKSKAVSIHLFSSNTIVYFLLLSNSDGVISRLSLPANLLNL